MTAPNAESAMESWESLCRRMSYTKPAVQEEWLWMAAPSADRRFCVCGWSTTDPEPHDHDQRTRENAIRNADALGWAALEAEIAREGS